jgi:hypothetical protein
VTAGGRGEVDEAQESNDHSGQENKMATFELKTYDMMESKRPSLEAALAAAKIASMAFISGSADFYGGDMVQQRIIKGLHTTIIYRMEEKVVEICFTKRELEDEDMEYLLDGRGDEWEELQAAWAGVTLTEEDLKRTCVICRKELVENIADAKIGWWTTKCSCCNSTCEKECCRAVEEEEA